MKRTLLIFMTAFINQHVVASSLEELSSVDHWSQLANGIWKTQIGDAEKELSYTDLAAEAPKLKTINELGEVPFPFKEGEIQYLITDDHKIMLRIPTDSDEKLYGFGLQFDGLQKSKKVLTLNMDHWGLGQGRTHAPVPFYISSKGYGVFFNTSRFLKVYNQLGNRKDSLTNPEATDRNPPPGEAGKGWNSLPQSDAVEVSLSAKGLDVMVFAGNSLLEVVQRYNLYNGGGALPPLWGLGFWHRVHAHHNAEQTNAEVAAFKERSFPLDVIGLEPGWMTKSYPCTYEWQTKRFPDPKAFTQELLGEGVRLNLWINPYISPEAKTYKAMYPLAGSHLVWLGIVPDYNLSEARKVLTDQFNEDHLTIGISGYKVDEVDGYDKWLWPDHATFPSGVNGETMRQSYGLLMQRMLYQDLFKKNNIRSYGNVRASNGAASGYPFVIYNDAYKHSEYITGISASSLCGTLWTPEARSASSDREWLNRMQTVCFSAMAKLNGWGSGAKPWSYEPVTDKVREVVELRMRLLPYLYSAFADYHFKGIPPMRAMILESGAALNNESVIKGKLDSELDPYAEDKIVEVNDQFMFGASILVAPFYEAQDVERSVQLPVGKWYNFYTGEYAGNGNRIRITAAELEDRIPLFVKEGAIIPMLSNCVTQTEDAYGQDLEIRVYGYRTSAFDLYEDDGKTFDFQQGQYRFRKLVTELDEEGNMFLTESSIVGEGPSMFGAIERIRMMTQKNSHFLK